MIEIIILFGLGQSIAARADKKGLCGAAYVFLLLALWIGGEFGGACAAHVVARHLDLPQGPYFCAVYGAALGCAILGAVMAFQLVDLLPANEQAPLDKDWKASTPEHDT